MVDLIPCAICGTRIPSSHILCRKCIDSFDKPEIPEDLPEETKMRIERYYRLVGPLIPANVSKYLIDGGFFSAPASTCHHGAYDGGLFDHSFQVAIQLAILTWDNDLEWENKRSPYVVGMLHDLCKIDQYRKLDEPDEKGRMYAWNETPVKGHGDKSLILLKELMDLTDEEEACIRYHMGAFTDKEEWSKYTDAIHRFQNVLWTHHADMITSHILMV